MGVGPRVTSRRFGETPMAPPSSPIRTQGNRDGKSANSDAHKVRTGFRCKPSSPHWSGDSRQAVTAMKCDVLGHVLFVGYENGCARIFDVRNLERDPSCLLHPVREWRVAPQGQAVRSITFALPRDGSKIPVFVTAAGLDVVIWSLRGERVARIGQSQPWPAVLQRDAQGQRIARASLALGLTQGYDVTVTRLSDLAKRKETARIRAEASIKREQRLKKEDDKQRTLQQMRARRGSVTLRRPTSGQRNALQELLAAQSQLSQGTDLDRESVARGSYLQGDGAHGGSKSTLGAHSDAGSKLSDGGSSSSSKNGRGAGGGDGHRGEGDGRSPEHTVRSIHRKAAAKVGPMRNTEPLRYTLDTPDIHRVVETYAVDTWRGGPSGKVSPRRMEKDARLAGFVTTKLRHSADERAIAGSGVGPMGMAPGVTDGYPLDHSPEVPRGGGRTSPTGHSDDGWGDGSSSSGGGGGAGDGSGEEENQHGRVLRPGQAVQVLPAGPASRLVAPAPELTGDSAQDEEGGQPRPPGDEGRRAVGDLDRTLPEDGIGLGDDVASDVIHDPSDVASAAVRQKLEERLQGKPPFRRAARVGYEYLGEAHWRRLPADSAVNKPRWAAEKRRIEAQRGLLARRARAVLREGEVESAAARRG